MGASFGLARRDGARLENLAVAGLGSGGEIGCLTGNREGGVWFGSEEDGLHFIRERPVRVFTKEDGLAGNDVRTLAGFSDGGLWAATAGGLSRYENERWRTVPLVPDALQSVATDAQGHPWFSIQAFGELSVRTGTTPPMGNFVFLGLYWREPNTLRFDRNGTLWVACALGLTWIKTSGLVRKAPDTLAAGPNVETPVFGRFSVGKELPKIMPMGLIEDSDGSIWLGSTDHGLFQIVQGHVKSFGASEGLPEGRAIPVFRDDSGAIWIVTDNGPARRQNGRFSFVERSQGLPLDTFLDLVEDDAGTFWITGQRGIHRVERRELEDVLEARTAAVHTLTLGLRDGLLTPECSSLHYPTMAKTANGFIWVATRNGIARFDPRRIHRDTHPLPTLVDRVVVNRRDFPTVPNRGAPLRLPAGSGQQLEFHFTAISLLGADRITFRHRLEGYDSEWSPETDLRLAFYTNLRPGNYRFRVKSSNAHGIWSDEEASLGFAILPFFWQTTAFKGSSALALLGLAGGLHWRRLRALRRQEEVRHQQALTDEKARIAADMHDELGATLTQITILGEVAKSQTGDQAQTRSTLDRMSQAAREVTTRMSELVWATNPRNDTLDNLVAGLREQAASQFESSAVQARLGFPSTVPDCRVSATFRRNLLLVLKEALHNVVKHSQASQVTVQLEINDRELHLQIADNGLGFDPSLTRSRGNGLGNMERRIRDLGGRFDLGSQPGQGVCTDCRVPLDQTNT